MRRRSARHGGETTASTAERGSRFAGSRLAFPKEGRPMSDQPRSGLAVVTGASTGIGLELAKIASQDGDALLIVADAPEIDRAAAELRGPARTPSGPGRGRRGGAGRPRDDRRQRPADRGDRRSPGRRAVRQRRPRPRPRLPRPGFHRCTPRHRYQRHRHRLPDPEGRQRHARARARQAADHRLDRRLYARQLPGGLQWHQGLSRQLLVRDPQRAEGQRRHRHLPDARSHRH